jgi:hypothetical protein
MRRDFNESQSRAGWVEERNPTSTITRNCKMIEKTISAQQPYFVGFRKLNPTYELVSL